MTRGIRGFVLIAMVVAALGMSRPAHATSKEMIELQTQVQQLMDAVQRLQSTMDTKFGVLQHLVEQAADNSNQLNASFNALQLKITTQNDALNGKLDTASGQTQSVNDSLDELKTRIERLDKQLKDLSAQLQSIQAAPSNASQSSNSAPTASTGAPTSAPSAQQVDNSAPPLQQLFQSGMRDYTSAHYTIATSEFNDVIQYYPNDALAGDAEFYLGEIEYKQKHFDESIKHYNTVLDKFSGNSNAAVAQLHKGFSLLAEKKRDAGVHELKVLVQRHPQSPEADQAKIRLDAIGVPVK